MGIDLPLKIKLEKRILGKGLDETASIGVNRVTEDLLCLPELNDLAPMQNGYASA